MFKLKWRRALGIRHPNRPGHLSAPLALFTLTVLTRLPFQSQYLYHWDSVNFALAIERFDLRSEQPHPPGYLLYVWLCRWLNRVMGDPQLTMVAISIVGSALAVAALYFLGSAMFSRKVGLIGAVFLMSSPLFWFYGEIALPHAFDAFFVILSAWLAYRVQEGEFRLWPVATMVLAMAGGLRPQTLVFLGPLLAFSLRKAGWKRILAAIGLGFLLCLLWFLPLIQSVGGLSNYLEVLSRFGLRFEQTTSIFQGAGAWGLTRNLRKLMMYTLYGWGLCMVFALPILWNRIRSGEWLISCEAFRFLLVWIGPSILFYSLVHMGQQGLVFVFLPALLLISAVGLDFLFSVQGRWASALLALVLVANAGLFLFAPEYPLGNERLRILNRKALERTDREYGERFETIARRFPPGSTAILAADWRHAEYYLPEYVVLHFDIGSKWELDEGKPKVPPQSQLSKLPGELGMQIESGAKGTLVIFDEELEDFNRSSDRKVEMRFPDGLKMDYLEIEADAPIIIDQNGFGVGVGSP